MADILRVTTPLNGQDAASRVRPNTNQDPTTNINNTINPSRVPGNDRKDLNNDQDTNKFSPHLKSNFDSFLNKLASTPGMSAETARLFFTRYGSIVSSGMSGGIAAEMAKYLQMMKVTDAELLNLLKGMQGSSVKFTGSFFDIIRDLMSNKNVSGDAKALMLEFLRRYDAITANDHALKNILSNLNNIADRMMKSSGDKLREMAANIDTTAGKGNVSGNLAFMRENLIPLLSNYIAQTKDYGSVRDNISLFILNFARYEMGGKEAFSEALNSLLGIPEISSKVSNSLIAELADSIFAGAKGDKAHLLQDQLVNILTKGLDGQAGYQNTQVFQNILQSALLNESVYMPLLHMMFPVEYNGRQMFSEVWVDPDSDERNEKEAGTAVKLLVKFDIKDLGFFEMILLVQNSKVDMQFFYPEGLEPMKGQIKDSIFAIMERNELKFRSYMADKCAQPKAISDVFHKLFEGRNMVNVTA
ncbi:hypothetical protein Ami103574_03225 [Aminipila butyrica]|uniref:Uncharacterized protein n=1 Tax=Aminipila butyrica TaxID=433296 RepID=A0A858BS31_9FIRM|nr:hypothetical protein [Aminipila butyrica]QIB68387.1 hypothetical protein Ami103574_03225 [Aminipila butyrica]